MRCIYHLTIGLLLIFLVQVSSVHAETKTFSYIFHETTGIAHHVIKDGKEVPIQFSDDSSQTALAALKSLDWRVLYSCGNGKYIFLEGELSNELKRTQSGPLNATSQEYREFKLLDWHILTPFPTIELVDSKNPMGKTKVVQRASLKKAGFDAFEMEGKKISHALFERHKISMPKK